MSDNKKEVRFACREMRATGSGKRPQIVGYAAKFNSQTELMPGMFEVIRPGAFTRTLAEKADVRCLFNHDEDIILGRTKSGTLRLTEDKTGLHFVCDVADTVAAMDVYKSVQRGDIDQCSFGFTCSDEFFTKTPTGQPLRELHECDLFDVSVVTYPAYESTSAEARSRALWPTGRPEHLRADNIARTLRNHSRAANEDAATFRAKAQRRAKNILDEIAQEDIERQKQRLNAAFL
jgi:HK97 family phage prohead protease